MYWLNSELEYYVGTWTRGATACQERPSLDYKLIPDPLSDPMNCWIAKTPTELDAEKDALANLLDDLKPVIESVAEIIYENPDLVASFATVNLFKVAIKDRYKSKLP